MPWNFKKSKIPMSVWTTGVKKTITLEGRKKMFAAALAKKQKTKEVAR